MVELVLKQGAESNLSGRFLERAVEACFTDRGIPVFDFSDDHKSCDWINPVRLLRNVPYTSIYGSESRTEFVYEDQDLQRSIRIECKWQESQGSVDEKWPYVFMNALETMPEKEVWIVHGGGGARRGSIEWLRARCAVAPKSIEVFTIEDVRKAVKRLRG